MWYTNPLEYKHIHIIIKAPVNKLCIPPLSEISMSNNQALDILLEELEIEENKQKTRLQEELITAITKYIKNREDPKQKQIDALKREVKRLTKILDELPKCKCKNRPIPCDMCGKMFKNPRTCLQHSKNLHCMADISFSSQSHTVDYPYANYYTNGNGSSYTPHTPYSSCNM